MTWVSTTIPSALWKALPRTTFAVLRATPGRASSSSIVSGTSPLYFSAMILQAAIIFFALLLWKLTLLMYVSSSFISASANSWADLYFWNNWGVIRFTNLSVAWAERIVAIRSWRGLEWFKAVRG